MHSYLGGKELNQMFSAMIPMFELNVDTLNNLNVFPVPDGDTGINMFLTLKDAFAEVEKSTSANQSSSDFLKALSKGALFGARGNSGVILSQFFKGFVCVYILYFQTMCATCMCLFMNACAQKTKKA